jgi:hypothetical protein
MHYTVYGFFDPRDGAPRYIGQGKGKRYRWWHYAKGDTQYGVKPWLRGLKALGLEPEVLILADGLTRAQALAWEVGLIATIGRTADKAGPLLNLSSGGEGGHGCKVSAETRRKLSEVNRERYADPAERAKQAEAARKRYADPAEHTRQAEAAKQAWADPALCQRQAEATRQQYADPAKRARILAAHSIAFLFRRRGFFQPSGDLQSIPFDSHLAGLN